MEPLLSATSTLVEQGVLGIILVLFLFLYLREVRDGRKTIKVYEKQLRDQAATHKAEQDILRERYITKAESWMAQHYANVQAQTEAMAALAGQLAEKAGEGDGS